MVLIAELLRRRSSVWAVLCLAKDDHRFLSSFGYSAEQVVRASAILGIVLLSLGITTFEGQQDSIRVNEYHQFLVPALAIAIASPRLAPLNRLLVAVIVIVIERLTIVYWETTLGPFSTSVVFAAIVIWSILGPLLLVRMRYAGSQRRAVVKLGNPR